MNIKTKFNIGDKVATADGYVKLVSKIEVDVLSDGSVEVVYGLDEDEMGFEYELSPINPLSAIDKDDETSKAFLQSIADDIDVAIEEFNQNNANDKLH